MSIGPKKPAAPLRWRRGEDGYWYGLQVDRHWRKYDNCPTCGRRKRASSRKCFHCKHKTRNVVRWQKKADRHWVGYDKCPGGCGNLKRVVAKLCCECRYKVGPHRVCRGCNKKLPISAFRIRIRASKKPRSRCKKCEAAATREYNAQLSPERTEEIVRQKRQWEKDNPEKHRLQILRHRIRILGLTAETDRIVRAVETTTSCIICGRTPKEAGTMKGLHIDHCHRSKKFRGLICGKCNVGLGHFDDDPDHLRAAADYVTRHGR